MSRWNKSLPRTLHGGWWLDLLFWRSIQDLSCKWTGDSQSGGCGWNLLPMWTRKVAGLSRFELWEGYLSWNTHNVTAYGFQNSEKWFRCFGEVFKIYARGKSLGSAITAHDTVMLFYIQDQKWVGLDTTYVGHRTCPGTARPPPSDKYERCWGEAMEVWKRWTVSNHLLLWPNWYCCINRLWLTRSIAIVLIDDDVCRYCMVRGLNSGSTEHDAVCHKLCQQSFKFNTQCSTIWLCAVQ